jgi:hemin uptake protein HemP
MSTLTIEAGELTADEILDALADGSRIVVRVEMLGGVHEVTLRHDGTTYYCDTPTTLHKHDTTDEMRTCIERMGYGRDAAGE